MAVNDNQLHLFEAVELLFESPPLPASAEEFLSYSYTDSGHGRIDTRTLESSTALNEYLDWHGTSSTSYSTFN